MAVETPKGQVLTLQYASNRQGGMGVQIWHLPPAEDSHFRYCRCWERSDENARDEYLQPRYYYKKNAWEIHFMHIEEKWVKEAWSDWNRRFENRQSSVKWAVTKLNNDAHPFLRITPCYTPLLQRSSKNALFQLAITLYISSALKCATSCYLPSHTAKSPLLARLCSRPLFKMGCSPYKWVVWKTAVM